ncbi:phosphatase PAP2 family protein [Streptomyces pactum]|uniref:Phosphatase PAP2 family protein n=1 Tax=Streptomyces pactum TaxID=68249 RepID=A0ABS0NKF3_9ACTN|nr:phosphatase PAP2 family protein [Streptomyces pactum]MBH5335643.1 phosphatase PAP2 family protein [Streptomyces pactum]
MAGLALGSSPANVGGGAESNPDVSLLYDINGLAKDAPHWFDRVMEFVGEFGIIFGMALLMLGAWWSARRNPDAPGAVAGLVWAPLAAGLALIANIPIRNFVERPRPFKDHQGLEVLVDGKNDFSFVSDHATLAMALAVGVFMASRKYGLAAIGLALLEGFCRVYMGVHYPTDVVGGFALGTAVALLLAPLAMMLLTPLMHGIAGSRAGWLVRARPSGDAAAGPGPAGAPPLPGTRLSGRDEDLAA